MRFYDDTIQERSLVHDVWHLTGTDSSSYTKAQIARNMNRHYFFAVLNWIKSHSRIQFDDKNDPRLSIVTFDLVNGQEYYTNPADLLRINAIEVKDSNGDWITLHERDIYETGGESITDYQETDGIPREYDQLLSTFRISPAPSSSDMTLSEGGKIHISQDPIVFADDYTTGTATFTQSSTTVTGSGTDWGDEMIGRYITNTTDSSVAYQITAVASATSLTIAEAYAETGGSGKSYKISTDTLEPGFPTPFHSIMSLGASLDWTELTQDKFEKYTVQYEKLMRELRTFNANPQSKTRFRRRDHRTKSYM